MDEQPPENREEWLRWAQQKQARADAEKNETEGNGIDPDFSASEEKLRQLRIDIGQLNVKTTPEAVAAIVDRIVACTSDEIIRESLLKTVKAQAGTSVRTMRAHINRAAKNNQSSSSKSTRQVKSYADLTALIAEFNHIYAVVNEAGKAWVFRWNHDPALNREVLERMRFNDFLRLYENRVLTIHIDNPKKPNADEVTKTAAQWWLQSPDRRQYLSGVTFNPTDKAPDGYMNLWRGFSVKPKQGDWSLMRSHIERVLCRGNTEWSEYVLNWSARSVQCPNSPGEVALVFRGVEGCGKGTFGRWFAKIFGQHGLHIISPEQLVGRFNEHLRDCIALFADEAFYAGDKKHEGILKGLITEPFLPIEGKGLKVVVVPNMLHVILASNSNWVIPAAAGARRYAMFDVPDSRVGNLPYFRDINQQMEKGGLAAMLWDLQHRPLSTFEVRAFPHTDALTAQKKYSLDTISRWWLAILERGFVWQSRYGLNEFKEWMEFCPTQLLHRSYLQWCNDNRILHPENSITLGVWFTEIYRPGRPKHTQIVGELDTWLPNTPKDNLILRAFQPPGYHFHDLEQARDRFTEIRHVTGDWTTPEED
jgi:hypothetical protein